MLFSSHPPHSDLRIPYVLLAAEDLLVPRFIRTAVKDDEVAFSRGAAIHVGMGLFEALAHGVFEALVKQFAFDYCLLNRLIGLSIAGCWP